MDRACKVLQSVSSHLGEQNIHALERALNKSFEQTNYNL